MGDKVDKWFAVDVTCRPNSTEAVEFAFNELGSLGTEIDSLRKGPDESLRVSGYFATLPAAAELRHRLDDAIKIYDLSAESIESVETHTVEQTDWLAEWKKHWKPTEVGKFIITPPWESAPAGDKIVIKIEPNMAFGTGTHETTQLCLKAIGDLYQPSQTFLDVGTGTGILAIAAAKLGGKKILAYDTDADSVTIARENAVLNAVADRIQFIDGPVTPDTGPFDLVCANLTADVIVPILDLLIASTGKVLLLSGILADQRSLVIDALADRGLRDAVVETAGEWVSIVVRAAPVS